MKAPESAWDIVVALVVSAFAFSFVDLRKFSLKETIQFILIAYAVVPAVCFYTTPIILGAVVHTWPFLGEYYQLELLLSAALAAFMTSFLIKDFRKALLKILQRK